MSRATSRQPSKALVATASSLCGLILILILILAIAFSWYAGTNDARRSSENAASRHPSGSEVPSSIRAKTETVLRAPMVELTRGSGAAPSSLWGEVWSSRGGVLAHASVCLVNAPQLGGCCSAEHCVLADAQGRFTLLVEGSAFQLLASAAGHLSQRLVSSDTDLSRGLTLTLATTESTLSGQVVDTTGGSVQGALVTARAPTGSQLLATSQSDAAGRFSMGLTAGSVELSASADSYSVARLLVAAPAKDIVMSLTPASRISGRVLTTEGAPVARVAVMATVERGLPAMPVTVHSDVDGSFQLDDLAAGGYALMATAASWRSEPVHVDLEIAQASASVLLTVMPATTFTASLLAEGEPCLEGDVTLSGPEHFHGRIEAEGRVQFEGVRPGHYEVEVQCAGVGGRRERVEIGAEPSAITWDLEAGSALLSGKVVDREGRPMPGAAIEVQPIGEPRTRALTRCVSDAGGEFTCPGMAPGDYECSLAAGLSDALSVTLIESSPTRVILQPRVAGTIVARVSADRAETSGVRVFVRGSSPLPYEGTRSGDEFSFEGLDLGRYRLYLGSADEAAPAAAEVTLDHAGQVALVILQAPPASSISGRVSDEEGTPIPDAWVRAFTSAGMVGYLGSAAGEPTLTDEQGAFSLQGLYSGHYDLQVTTSSGEGSAQRIAVGSDAVQIRVTSYAALSGTLESANGDAVPVFTLAYRCDDGPTFSIDAGRGVWTLPWIPPGNYEITARTVGEAAYRQVRVAPGSKSSIDLTLAPVDPEATAQLTAPNFVEQPTGSSMQK